MKHSIKNAVFVKKATAIALTAVSCFSLMGMPVSDTKPSLADSFNITASAATGRKLLLTSYSGTKNVSRELTVSKHYNSSNGKFTLVFQTDGNLVVYRRDTKTGKLFDPLWSSKTAGNNGARCFLQEDGNLVIYTKDMKKALWNTRTHGKTKAELYISDDGEVSIYSGLTGSYVWSNGVHTYVHGNVSTTSYLWPVPASKTISSPFGPRWGTQHNGVDISAGYGSNVVAVQGGTVYEVCTSCTHNWGKNYSCGCGGGYGNYVKVRHENGDTVVYAHLGSLASGIKVGSVVTSGQKLGVVGSTGHSTGAHLHFGFYKYQTGWVDPMLYLPR